MMRWPNKLGEQFKAWRENNSQAHAKSKPDACCSAPPPGAGGAVYALIEASGDPLIVDCALDLCLTRSAALLRAGCQIGHESQPQHVHLD